MSLVLVQKKKQKTPRIARNCLVLKEEEKKRGGFTLKHSLGTLKVFK